MVHMVSGGRDPAKELENPLKAIDGDFEKVALLDATPDGGLPITRGYRFASGRPVDGTHMPTRLRRGGPKDQPLLEIEAGYGSCLLVSPEVRALIEELEPGVHQFFPMTVEQNGRTLGTRHQMVVCNRLDTIDRALSVPVAAPGQPYRPEPGGANRIVFSGNAIGDHHAWRDRFVRGLFLSDTLVDRIHAAGFRGLKHTHYEESPADI